MNHSFDVDIATQYGINAAVVLQDMAYWCEHSRINNTNFHEDKYWTYNTNKALCEHYPYMSGKAIRTAIQKLIDAELIVTGCFNKLPFDRTLWYALTEKGESLITKGRLDFPKKENDNFPKSQISTSQKGEAIPYSVSSPVSTQDIPRKGAESDKAIAPGFDEFWAAYPIGKAKSNAVKAWKKLKPDADLQKIILDDIRRRKDGEWKDIDKHYIPYAATYLNGARWTDEQAAAEPAPKSNDPYANETPEERERRSEAFDDAERRRIFGDDYDSPERVAAAKARVEELKKKLAAEREKRERRNSFLLDDD